MSYWDLSGDAEPVKEVVTEVSGGMDLVFPGGTWLKVSMDEAKWGSKEGGERSLRARFTILAPEEFNGVKIANRKLFSNFWLVNGNLAQKGDGSQKYKEKHWKLFMGIDANCGGLLLKKAQKSGQEQWLPSDEDIAETLLNKPFSYRLAHMVSKEDGKNINWLDGIAPATKPTELKGVLYNKREDGSSGGSSQVNRQANGTARYDDGEDIPF